MNIIKKLRPLMRFALCICMAVLCHTVLYSAAMACDIIAHRGASSEAPENTLASINLAWEQGADIVEFDIHLTEDEEIVVIHDEDTERTAGVKLKVKKTSFAELRKLDVGSWFSPEFAGEKIPTLAEALATVPEGKRVAIEVKCHGNIVSRLAEEIKKSGLKDEQILVISFKHCEMKKFKEVCPQYEVCILQTMRKHLITRRWKHSAKDILKMIRENGVDGCVVKAVSAIDAKFVRTIKSQGYKFRLYTVDDEVEAQKYMSLHVDGFATNCPQKMLELRSQVW